MAKQFATDVLMLTTADSGPRDPRECRLGVFHTTENSDTARPEDIARWQQDRNNGSSYNVLVGTTGRSVRSNDDDYIPWAAGATGNRIGIHASAVGYAARQRADWLKFPDQLETLARWAADLNTRYGIPLVWLSAAEVRAGARGFCGHAEISAAFKEVDHTDPGRGFPHDLILKRAAAIVAGVADHPKESSPMPDDNRLDLILDQHLGHPYKAMPGWDQLGGRSLVDALGAVGEKLGVPGCYDTRRPAELEGDRP